MNKFEPKIVGFLCDWCSYVGGFHGFNNFSVIEDLDFICPCHCTAYKRDLKKAFPDKISDCGVGKVVGLNVVV